MKQGFLIIAVLGLAVGCSEDPQAAEQTEAARTFDEQAMAHFRNISGGYIADSDAQRVDQTLAEYQGAEREQAIEALGGLLNKGSDLQQVSTAVALADLYAQQAREHSQAGLAAWTRLASTGQELQVKADAARRRQVLATGMDAIDNATELAEAREQLNQLNDQRQTIDERIDTLQEELEDLTESRREFMTERETAKQRADELRGRSYDAERQTRFDLQVEAAEYTRDADQAGLEAERVSLRIDLLEAELAVAEGKRRETDARIEGVEAVIDQYNQSGRERSDQVDQRRQAAATAAEEVVDGLEEMAETFKTEVADRFEQADQAYQEAIEVLEQAQSKATGPLRPVMDLELGAHQNGHGQTLRQFASVRAAFSNQLFAMAERAEATLPDPSRSSIIEMAQAAQERTSSARDRASEALQTAVETLEAAQERLSGRSELEGIAEAARGQLNAANASLAALNDQSDPGDAAQFSGTSEPEPGDDDQPDRDPVAALSAGDAGPDETVEAVAHELAAGNPEILWTALPPQYQDDLTEVIRAFGEAMDPEVYDQGFALAGQLADVLDEKREFILNHPGMGMNPDMDPEALRDNWDRVVAALRTLVDSPLGSTQRLAEIDPEALLRDGLASMLQQFSTTADATADRSMADLADVRARVLEMDGDTAVVEITGPDGTSDGERMMRVDGRWVPADMAQAWDQQMDQARQMIAMLDEEGIPDKEQVMQVMGMIEMTLNELAATESQEEFNEVVDQIMEQVGPMLMMFVPMGPGGGPGGPMGPGDMPEGGMPDGDMPEGFPAPDDEDR